MSGDGVLAELAGLEGAFVFTELLLQRLWLRGDFDARALRLRDGRRVELLRRGRWNRGGGPDFFDAEIRIENDEATEVVRGAIEVHLRATDWTNHRHAEDPAYDQVILHVVLFPSRETWTSGRERRRIPILELLPWLERDLEAYAAEAAVEGLAGRPFSQLREWLTAVSSEPLAQEVARRAEFRWRHKVATARARLERLGWREACHHCALEVLGYRFNRAPMLLVAQAVPLADWSDASPSVETLLAHGAELWRKAGVRPANQPRARLLQYSRWAGSRPEWPERLLATAREHATDARPAGWRKEVFDTVTGGQLGGSRFDTMVCDGWLPLLAASEETGPWQAWWMGWRPGDLPDELKRLAKEFLPPEAGGRQGALQGLLGWLAERGTSPSPRSETP